MTCPLRRDWSKATICLESLGIRDSWPPANWRQLSPEGRDEAHSAVAWKLGRVGLASGDASMEPLGVWRRRTFMLRLPGVETIPIRDPLEDAEMRAMCSNLQALKLLFLKGDARFSQRFLSFQSIAEETHQLTLSLLGLMTHVPVLDQPHASKIH